MCVCACVSTCASGVHICGVGGQQVSLSDHVCASIRVGGGGSVWMQEAGVSLRETKLGLKLWEKLCETVCNGASKTVYNSV